MTEFKAACRKAGRRCLTLAEVAALPYSKADEKFEAEEFLDACDRAEAKGDRAHELLSAAPRPDRADVLAMASDFEPTR